MAIYKGQNLRLKIGGKYVAYATDCTLHVGIQLENSSTKDSDNGMWTNQEITGKSWDISTSALYSVEEDATGLNAENVLDMVLAGQRAWVEFVVTTGEKNRTEVQSSNKYCGWVWLNDNSITATNRANATYSLQAQGDGALTKNADQPSNSDI